ncbi:MAG: hypothetical protein WBD20_24710 [Pirellulaceae bacterium]
MNTRDPRLTEEAPARPAHPSADRHAAPASLGETVATRPKRKKSKLTASMAPPATVPVGGKPKDRVARPKRGRFKLPNTPPAWLKKFFFVALAASLLYFVYGCVQSVNQTLQRNQQNDAITDVWRQLLLANTNISGTPTQLDENGQPRFPTIEFQHSRSKQDLHRNLRLAAALPGVRALGLQAESTRMIGRGFADDETVSLVIANFPSLDSIDVSGTKVTALEPLTNLNLRELKMINAPIRREKLADLALLKITDLWIGWEPDSRDPEQELFASQSYRAQVIKVIARMPNLQNLFLYNLSFTKEELEQLPQLNMNSLRVGD